MTPLQHLITSELGFSYNPEAKVYSMLSPAKAAVRLLEAGWTKEKEVVRHHANGNDEYLTIISKPAPPPPPPPTRPTPTPVETAAKPDPKPATIDRIKEAIRGSRKPA